MVFLLLKKGGGTERDVDSRKTIFSEHFGGKIISVNKEGMCIVAAKGATSGDLSTSLSASSSNTDQEADELIFCDIQDDGDDGVCFR